MACTTLARDTLEYSNSAIGRFHRRIYDAWLNRQRFQCPLAYLQGSARKAGEHLHSLATGGEAEPSPPRHGCPGCAFTQPPPTLLRYGAGLARQTFASRLYLRQRVELLKATPQCSISPAPWRLVPRQRERQLRHHRSPSSVTGRPSPPGGIARGGWHVRPCIRVYASPVGMKCKSKKSAPKGAIPIGERCHEQRVQSACGLEPHLVLLDPRQGIGSPESLRCIEEWLAEAHGADGRLFSGEAIFQSIWNPNHNRDCLWLSIDPTLRYNRQQSAS